MAAVDTQAPTEPTPQLPDYVTDPNAVLKDHDAKWRYTKAPDYSKTRKVYAETKKFNHQAGSLPDLVENLVKNWEVEASFKTDLKDWRTVDHEKYTFGVNGGPPQTGEHMLKVGTYNAVIGANEYYSPNYSDFASSHKTFKRMMPTFAWEVVEVYSGPPTVSFQWRHWGVMKNDYVGFNNKGEKVTAKAHGGPIEIFGVTVATVNDKLQLQRVETWFDSLEMFRQIAPKGVVNKMPIDKKVSLEENVTSDVAEHVAAEPKIYTETAAPGKEVAVDALGFEKLSINGADEATSGANDVNATNGMNGDAHATEEKDEFYNAEESHTHAPAPVADTTSAHAPTSTSTSTTTPHAPATNSSSSPPSASTLAATITSAHRDAIDTHLEQPSAKVHPHPKNMEEAVQPAAGEAVVAPPESEEVRRTHEEMRDGAEGGMGCPFLMNRE